MAASSAAKSGHGVVDADDDIMNQKLTVTFDDEKTNADEIRNTMKKEGYPAEGEVEFLKH